MIKKVLFNISKGLATTEENRIYLSKYSEMTKTEGWKVYQGLLLQICNDMSSYMFSDEFTKLDKEEKDVRQRSFVITKEIIDFLINPAKGVENLLAIQKYNQNLESTIRKKPKGKQK